MAKETIRITWTVYNDDTESIKEVEYPRQKAIEIMAETVCRSPYKTCSGCVYGYQKADCKRVLEEMKEEAEIALNALLGVEK